MFIFKLSNIITQRKGVVWKQSAGFPSQGRTLHEHVYTETLLNCFSWDVYLHATSYTW